MSDFEHEIKRILAKHSEIKKGLLKLQELGLPTGPKGNDIAEGGLNSEFMIIGNICFNSEVCFHYV